MDVIIRFLNAIAEKIEVHYLDSKFLKRPNAINLLNKLLEAMKSLPLSKKLIQLSMDGPNTKLSSLLPSFVLALPPYRCLY